MQIATIGLDIAKNVFQVHGIDASRAGRCQEATAAPPGDGVLQGACRLALSAWRLAPLLITGRANSCSLVTWFD